jgi:nitrous oxidase accessory protein
MGASVMPMFKLTKTRVIALFLWTLLLLNAFSVVLNGKSVTTITVLPADGTIQEAINMANQGDTIRVAAGTYNENVIVNKSITLMGDGQHLTFLIGNGVTAVITVTANNVNISGFSIKNGIQGVLLQSSNKSTISNNKIASNKRQGVHLNSCHNNTLMNNKISLNGLEGIFFQNSSNNLVNGNVVANNKYVGINIRDSNNNRISNNTITFHKNQTLHAQGILSVFSNNTLIEGNIILNNAWGIDAYESVKNTVYNNIISKNYQGIDLSESSNNNNFYHNDFVNNTKQVSSYLVFNTWDNGTEGNYWSDYTGGDSDGDGIGDAPYTIDENNQDNYPLMNRRRPVYDVTAPITSDDYDGLWHNQDFMITLTAEDYSGIKAIYYKINGTGPVQNISANGQPLITAESANNTLEYWSEDNAVPSNEEEPHNILTEIKLDKTVPYGSLIVNNNDINTTSPSVTLNLFGNDTLSGISQMRFRNEDLNWTSLETYNTTKNWDLSSGDGLKTVYVQYMDNAGLVSQPYNDTIILDTAAPAVSILFPTNGLEIRSSEVNVQWNGTDAGVGLAYYEIRLDQGSWINVTVEQLYTFNWVNDGSHTVYVRAVDKIEHSREVSVNFSVNTNPIPFAYLEVAALATVLAVAVGITICVLRNKKKSAGVEAKRVRGRISLRL